MKHIYIIVVLISSLCYSQIPTTYYDSAEGLTGFALKTKLKTIVSNGHQARSYGQLYDGNGINGSNGYIAPTLTRLLAQEKTTKAMELF